MTDFGKMKIDTYTIKPSDMKTKNSSIKMKQSTKPPIIKKKEQKQKGRRYKTKISIAGETQEKNIATSTIINRVENTNVQGVTFGKPVEG